VLVVDIAAESHTFTGSLDAWTHEAAIDKTIFNRQLTGPLTNSCLAAFLPSLATAMYHGIGNDNEQASAPPTPGSSWWFHPKLNEYVVSYTLEPRAFDWHCDIAVASFFTLAMAAHEFPIDASSFWTHKLSDLPDYLVASSLTFRKASPVDPLTYAKGFLSTLEAMGFSDDTVSLVFDQMGKLVEAQS